MNTTTSIACNMLMSIYAVAKDLGDKSVCGILSQLDLTRFSLLDAEKLKKFAESQQHIFSIAPIRSGIANTTGLTALVNAVASEQYELYANRVRAYFSMSDQQNCKKLTDIHFNSSAYLLALHALSQSNPNAAMISLMCTKSEIDAFSKLTTAQLIKFTTAGIIPFTFATEHGNSLIAACETDDYTSFKRDVERARICRLSALI